MFSCHPGMRFLFCRPVVSLLIYRCHCCLLGIVPFRCAPGNLPQQHTREWTTYKALEKAVETLPPHVDSKLTLSCHPKRLLAPAALACFIVWYGKMRFSHFSIPHNKMFARRSRASPRPERAKALSIRHVHKNHRLYL